MRIKVNRKDFIEYNNIEKLVLTSRGLRVYKKEGYPRILLADCTYNKLLQRLLNVGVNSKKLEELINRR